MPNLSRFCKLLVQINFYVSAIVLAAFSLLSFSDNFSVFSITEVQSALPDAEDWNGKEDKLKLLER